MKIISFNINGLRARPHQLAALVEQHQPDFIGLQEIKVHDEEFPLADVQALGYHVYHFGQKGHYGVAVLSKTPAEQMLYGFPSDGPEAQRRMLIGRWTLPNGQVFTLLNGYFPQGESRDHPQSPKIHHDHFLFLPASTAHSGSSSPPASRNAAPDASVSTSNPADRSNRPSPPRTNGSSSTTAIRGVLVAIGSTIGDADGEGYYTLVTYRQTGQPPSSKCVPPLPVLRQFHAGGMCRKISFRRAASPRSPRARRAAPGRQACAPASSASHAPDEL